MKDISHIGVKEKFGSYPENMKKKLLKIRELIFQVAEENTNIGELEETTKWGEPSYVTLSKSGSTIRIDRVGNSTTQYGMFFNCKTSLISSFKEMFGDQFTYSGTRAILLHANDDVPLENLKQCIYMSLTYNLQKSSN